MAHRSGHPRFLTARTPAGHIVQDTKLNTTVSGPHPTARVALDRAKALTLELPTKVNLKK